MVDAVMTPDAAMLMFAGTRYMLPCRLLPLSRRRYDATHATVRKRFFAAYARFRADADAFDAAVSATLLFSCPHAGRHARRCYTARQKIA